MQMVDEPLSRKLLDAAIEATVGLLSRRPVQLGSLVYIGKESNAFEQVEQGLVHSRKDVQPTYRPSRQEAWDLIYLPAVQRIPLARLTKVTRLGSRVIRYFWKSERRPSPEVEGKLSREAHRWARQAMRRKQVSAEDRQVAERVLAATSPGAAPKLGAATQRTRRRASRRNGPR